MAVNGYFFDAVEHGGVYDRVYSAEDFSNYLDQIVGNGVFPNPSTQLQVRAGSGMQIIVGSGQGWIYGHKVVNTADLPLTVASSDVLLNRIDLVIFYADFVNREMGIEILEGTPAAQATAPQLTRNESRYEMCLAQITINKQINEITQAMITDTRADSTVCGWVAGLIQQVDTSTLFTQWQTAYSDYYNTMTAAFNAWMETLTQELKVNTYIQKYYKRVVGGSGVSNVIPLNMSGYTYDNDDVLIVSINGLMGIPDVDYTLDTTKTPVAIQVNNSMTSGNSVEITALKSVIGINTSP